MKMLAPYIDKKRKYRDKENDYINWIIIALQLQKDRKDSDEDTDYINWIITLPALA